MARKSARSETGSGGARREFVVTYTFDAPRELVWRAHTELDHLRRWWGPKGFTWVTGTLDLRPGGMFHYGLRSPGGQEMWGRCVYREIAAPQRLVYVVSFSDEAGGITRHPMSGTWPLEVLSTAVFAERDGKTVLTLTGAPIGATEAEARTFADGFESMRMGYGASLDQLAAYLAELAAGCGGPFASPPLGDEHRWLGQLAGRWTYEAEAVMGPGLEPMRSKGSETVRSLGGLWIVADGQVEMLGGGPAATMMTLGFDPRRGRFVGTWVGSMMNHLWVYDGALDAARRVLTLDAEGPAMTGDGSMAKYQDIIEVVDADYRVLTSRVLGADGSWRQFMTAHYRRQR